MTNWMTAAGIALIAGGLATLICFRTVLFGGGGRRARSDAEDGIQPKSRRARGNRRRDRVAEPVAAAALPALPADVDQRAPHAEDQDLFPYEDEPVDVPYAVEEPYEVEALYEEPYDPEPYEPELEPALRLVLDDIEEEVAPAYSEERYGHRVEGWVRPEYSHVPEEPPAGEYWTPIPVDLEPDPEPSAKGYGWPMAVERLPSVPDYEPSTGFDLAPIEHEPTEIVAPRTPARKRRDRAPISDRDRANRIRLPRSWSARDDKYQEPAAREWRTENDSVPRRRRAESTQMFTAVTDDPPPASRRRPRPRPRPSAEPVDRSTTMYVSRHAAEPPPR
ncbi:hypothetical protein [Paractinoplanes lichenicola]|uniref:Uncharacterized protein n=1 Tax=Paractinoplanes lichenicola TaxID=2802976 RepID=A0ABS1VK04_9ACTN|nr:hypothetical protein [Actinoplanes lichenicola]MBL7254841.1 hypothetical protein [Actinoplanes lichenicola]